MIVTYLLLENYIFAATSHDSQDFPSHCSFFMTSKKIEVQNSSLFLQAQKFTNFENETFCVLNHNMHFTGM